MISLRKSKWKLRNFTYHYFCIIFHFRIKFYIIPYTLARPNVNYFDLFHIEFKDKMHVETCSPHSFANHSLTRFYKYSILQLALVIIADGDFRAKIILNFKSGPNINSKSILTSKSNPIPKLLMKEIPQQFLSGQTYTQGTPHHTHTQRSISCTFKFPSHHTTDGIWFLLEEQALLALESILTPHRLLVDWFSSLCGQVVQLTPI